MYTNAISSLIVSVGGYTAISDGHSRIEVHNDRFDGDIYSVWLSNPMIGNNLGGYSISKQSPLLLIGDISGTAFVDDSLITYAMIPPDFVGSLGLEFVDPDLKSYLISAEISFFQVSYPRLSGNSAGIFLIV